MDPLSVTTSVLTLIAACNALASTISKLHHLRHAPRELEQLEAEISALHSGTDALNILLHTHSDNQSDMFDHLSLGPFVKDARQKIEQTQGFLETSVLDLSSSSKIRKSVWLKWQSEFTRLRQELRDVRSQLGTCICLFNAAMGRGNLAQLQEMAMEGRAMHELQLRTLEAFRGELSARNTALGAEVDTKYPTVDWDLRSTTRNRSSTSLARFSGLTSPDDSLFENGGGVLAANVDSPRRHSEESLRVVEGLDQVVDEEIMPSPGVVSILSKIQGRQNENRIDESPQIKQSSAGQEGQLLVGYAGISTITPPCNEHACAQRQRTAVRFQYSFPVWSLIQSVLTLISCSSGTYGPERVLRMSRIRAGLDEVFIQVQSGNIRRLQQLFIQGSASPLDASDTGWTLLHYALSAGQLPAVRFLKDAGADVRAESTSRETPMDLAWNRILSGRLDEASEVLLRNVFDDDAELDERQFTTLHKIVLGMIGKSLADELEVTTAYINATDSSGNTPLAWASARGDHRSVVLLLEHGASLHIANDLDSQPIHLAAQTGNITTVRALVQVGADVNAVVRRTHMTPIHYAAEYQDNYEQILGLIDLGAQIDGRDYMSWTPLHWASWRGHLSSLKALLQYGADVNSSTADGNASIMLAVANNSHECVRELIESGANCSIVRHSQWNILHYAAIGGSVDTLRSLSLADLSAIDLQDLRTNDTGQSVADMLHGRLEALSIAEYNNEAHEAWKRAWDDLSSPSCLNTQESGIAGVSHRCLVRSDTDSTYFDALEQPSKQKIEEQMNKT
ncbi:MAG: hypothetical protein LQ339_004209 [Xanthoria mediterranea]|nr:MAG: hypothetical protein LQ339_004209 [Xanthoria mediterranea]